MNITLTHKIDNAVRNAQCACRLHTAANVFDVGLQFPLSVNLLALLLCLQLREVLLGKIGKASNDVAADQLLGGSNVAFLRHLNLELAGAEVQVEHLLNAGGVGGRSYGLMFCDLVAAGDTKVDAALSDEGWDIGGGQEDEGDGQVLDKRDV